MLTLDLRVLASLVTGDRHWLRVAAGLALCGVVLSLWSYRGRLAAMAPATALRIVGWLLLTACVADPLWSSTRPRRGANVMAVVADVSRSHLVAVDDTSRTRASQIAALLEAGEAADPPGWLKRLGQDFELRRYLISDRLRPVDQFGPPAFDGVASHLQTGLEQLKQRFDGQPLAGIILISDGNATDQAETVRRLEGIAPIHPIVLPGDAPRPDAGIRLVNATQTAFDDAPVTLQVQPTVTGATEELLKVTLLDVQGTPIESQTRAAREDSPLRFRHRPTGEGTTFYRVRVELLDAAGDRPAEELTTENNEQLIAVDRGSQPRRVLYVSGRPNWDFKFLRRAVEGDSRIQITGLIRIARREARFDFRGREGERSNPLFRGFDPTEQEIAEEYDEPVLVRLGTQNESELRGGFPETEAELFQYDAIVLDDLEADFFGADQMKLIADFVSRRGGGLMMMAGQESFRQGDYDRTPIGELLPVDLSRDVPVPTEEVRLSLTRDGWLQPWVRLRSEESEETERLTEMPGFRTVSTAAFIRPGAVVMAEVEDAAGQRWPALVVQRFGKGRTAALCIGDLWRWRLREGLNQLRGNPGVSGRAEVPGDGVSSATGATAGRTAEDLSDQSRACRQMLRWLVADVSRRLDVSVRPEPEVGIGAVRLTAAVRGLDFHPTDDAEVRFRVTNPSGKTLELSGELAESSAGHFEAVVAAAEAGPWIVETTAVVRGGDPASGDVAASPGTLVATTGWASQPDQQEMQAVSVNHEFLQRLASLSGGELVPADRLDQFVSRLPLSDVPVSEIWSRPIWHQWPVFLAAVACIVGEWTLRRRKGLP